jgi:hypothetical protein
MTQIAKKLRNDFAKRLIEAMAYAGVDDSPTTLARFFNLHSNGDAITMHGARRWLLGQSTPTQKHLTELAKMMGVSSAWLLLGVGEMIERSGSGIHDQDRFYSDDREVSYAYQSLGLPEKKLVWNLMQMLTRNISRLD